MKKLIYLLPLICAMLVVGPIEAKKKKYPNGDYYEGEWKKGAPHGQGIMKYANGDIYYGNWISGEKCGLGIMKYKNGNKYDGNWMFNKENGQGTMKYTDGNIYEGYWMAGLKSGQGMMKYLDGRIYDGEWKYDKINGQGRLDYPNGNFEEGIWKNGILYNGSVHNKYFKGSIKNKEFSDGDIKGYYNGKYYEGVFVNGKMNSGFTRETDNSFIIEIYYEAGIDIKGSIKSPSKWEYNGRIRNNLPFDEGTITFSHNLGKIDFNKDCTFLIYNDGTKESLSLPYILNISFLDNWIMKHSEKLEMKARVLKRFKEAQKQNLIISEIKNRENREKEVYWEQAILKLSHYIWKPSEVLNIYKNNPARFKNLFQYKYIIFNGIIENITGNTNYEYNYFLQDYVEYKYYTVYLSGGVYLESKDTNFISGLRKGQQIYFVGFYSNKDSFYQPLFDFKMYAETTQGLISLIKNNDLRLDRFIMKTSAK